MKKIYHKLFWKKVSCADGCWNWLGGRTYNGYGLTGFKCEHGQRAHRISYVIHFGDIPEGMLVLHHCDNRLCVRPDHLFLGTAKDNTRDMIKKGRMLIGSERAGSKLTEEDIVRIRESYKFGAKQKDLQIMYGMTSASISRIVTRTTWRHVN